MYIAFEILLFICLLVDIILNREQLREDLKRFGTWLSCLYRSTTKYILRLIKHTTVNK